MSANTDTLSGGPSNLISQVGKRFGFCKKNGKLNKKVALLCPRAPRKDSSSTTDLNAHLVRPQGETQRFILMSYYLKSLLPELTHRTVSSSIVFASFATFIVPFYDIYFVNSVRWLLQS